MVMLKCLVVAVVVVAVDAGYRSDPERGVVVIGDRFVEMRSMAFVGRLGIAEGKVARKRR